MKTFYFIIISTFVFLNNGFTQDYALKFDGVNDKVSLGDVPEFNVEAGEAISISLWVRTNSNIATQFILSKREGNNGYQAFKFTDNQIGINLRNINQVDCSYWTAAYLNDEDWHHMVLVINTIDSTSSFYFDGVQTTIQESKKEYIALGISSTKDLELGYNNKDNNGFMDGYLNEASIWTKALSLSEIQSLYNSGISGTPIGLLSHYKADDYDTPTVLTDSIGVNHGIITGAIYVDVNYVPPVYITQTPHFFSDNMILQRNEPITIWGSDLPQTAINVKFAGESKNTISNNNGNWSVEFDAREATAMPDSIIIEGTDTLLYENVVIGDIWVCSGQSNMWWKVINSDVNGHQAYYPNLRLLNMEPLTPPITGAFSSVVIEQLQLGKQYIETSWEVCTPEVLDNFSAVAYAFGKYLSDNVDVPIGLMSNAKGGSATESWISKDTLLKTTFDRLITDWWDCDSAGTWIKTRATSNLGDSINAVIPVWHPFMASAMHTGSIQPITEFPVKGAIWYQGESNAEIDDPQVIAIQDQILTLLIESWRDEWGNDFPFYFVQLPAINASSRVLWPEFREKQLEVFKTVNNTGMAVTIDIGRNSSNVHPATKLVVGERLAKIARSEVYGENIVYYGPTFDEIIKTNETTLKCTFYHTGTGMVSNGGGAVKGFELYNTHTQTTTPVTPTISGDTVIISIPTGEFHEVRYGWHMNTDCNLKNMEDLWASPFMVDIPVVANSDNHIMEKGIQVFPNPSFGNIIIKNKTGGNALFELTNLNGSSIFSISRDFPANINITSVERGIYLLKIKTSKCMESIKLVLM